MTWGPPIAVLTSQGSTNSVKTNTPAVPPFCLAGDAPINTTSRSLITSSFYDYSNGNGYNNGKDKPDWLSVVTQFYTDNIADLFEKHKVLVPTPNMSTTSTNGNVTKTKSYRIDIVSDICNRVFTRFAAGIFGIPLKLGMGNTVDTNVTTDTEDGYTEEQLYATLSTGFICIFNNLDVSKSFVVDQEARAAAKKLGNILMENSEGGKIGEAVEGLKGRLHSLVHDDKTERQTEKGVAKEKERLALKGYGREMVKRFVEGG